jgi:hypothetical protein
MIKFFDLDILLALGVQSGSVGRLTRPKLKLWTPTTIDLDILLALGVQSGSVGRLTRPKLKLWTPTTMEISSQKNLIIE